MASRRRSALVLVTGLAAALPACTQVPADLGRGQVQEQVRARGWPAEAADAAPPLVAEITAAPLSAESAIRLALVNNPDIRAHYAELGIAAAAVYRAGHIRNPLFSASVLDSNRSGEMDQITYGLAASFSDLITLPSRKRLARRQFTEVQYQVGAELVRLAAETEHAYYDYVTARQVAAMRGQVAKAAAVSLQLAERYFDAGNMTPRDLALERAAAAEAEVDRLQAEDAALAARTALADLLGLPLAGAWEVPAQLALPVTQEDDLGELLALARHSRLDLASASARAERLAEELCYTNWRRWLGELELGVERERETDGARLLGPTLSWEIPIFTQHRDQLLEVDAGLQMAIAEVARLMLDSDNAVRLAHAGVQNARARAETFRTRLLPARIEATQQAQLEENFMLIGTFELLLSKQREYNAYQGYLEALGDYWMTRAALAQAVGRRLPSGARASGTSAAAEDYLGTAAPAHGGHGAMHPGAEDSGEGKQQGEEQQQEAEDAHRHH
ncbi:TolC family protein [Microbulbifer taiwanensis]|uniref:TolC family protein n=1 Tax=Microbulbifer taiwanensis TaxID=986746 RepID=UPI001868234B|nr:TolC family protein [Microbulbifer taiwanensis]